MEDGSATSGALGFLLMFLLGYGLGSIPFGLLLTRWAGAGDIRSIGSGNIGATNVLRTGRKGLAARHPAARYRQGCAAHRAGPRMVRADGRCRRRVQVPFSATASRSGWAFGAARVSPPRPGWYSA